MITEYKIATVVFFGMIAVFIFVYYGALENNMLDLPSIVFMSYCLGALYFGYRYLLKLKDELLEKPQPKDHNSPMD